MIHYNDKNFNVIFVHLSIIWLSSLLTYMSVGLMCVCCSWTKNGWSLFWSWSYSHGWAILWGLGIQMKSLLEWQDLWNKKQSLQCPHSDNLIQTIYIASLRQNVNDLYLIQLINTNVIEESKYTDGMILQEISDLDQRDGSEPRKACYQTLMA